MKPGVIEQPKRFELSAAARQSSTWMEIERHLQERLQSLRIQNDARKSPEDTADLRGRIAEIKNLLALGQPDPVAN